MQQLRAARRFRRIAAAGVFFQGGAAALDSGTIIASLVQGLTGSALAVGAAAAIARYGWLFPQLFVAYGAQRRARRLAYYKAGAFGRVACLAALGAVLLVMPREQQPLGVAAFFVLWTLYAFVGGILAVPYNDIVARSVAPQQRSRLLALRFFGGGVLALLVAAAAHRVLGRYAFPDDYALVILLGAGLLLVSALCFVSAGEPEPSVPAAAPGFGRFLRQGVDVFRADKRFRLFAYARCFDGLATMALPFYVVLAARAGVGHASVAILLGAQTAGALLSNPLWGLWGDRRGKRSLLAGTALLTALAPVLTLVLIAGGGTDDAASALPLLGAVFFFLGAAGNGRTIAHLGYLMEISPDDRRPAYSGYFNAITAPAMLSPLLGAVIAESVGLPAVFAGSAAAALLQVVAVRRLRRGD